MNVVGSFIFRRLKIRSFNLIVHSDGKVPIQAQIACVHNPYTVEFSML